MIRLALLLLAVLFAAPAHAQFDEVEVTSAPVSGPVHVIYGAGGNLAVSVGEDGVLLVDCQFAPLADKIRTAIKEIGGTELVYILNTHYHGDHTGGNREFGPEAPIFSHVNVRKRVMQPKTQDDGSVDEAAPPEAWPVVTFEDGVSIYFNGEEIRVRHYPAAHTDGDAVVYFVDSGVIHMGDIFFHNIFPYVDLDGGGSVDGVLAAVDDILSWAPADAHILMGHGEATTLDDLGVYRTMVTETRDHVDGRVAAGKTADEIVAEGLPAEWADWTWSFIPEERWIRTLVADGEK